MTPLMQAEQAGEQLRKAIREHRYLDASRELARWRAALDAVLADPSPESIEILRQARTLLTWGRTRVMAGRADLAAQLAALPIPNRYVIRPPSRETWSVVA